MTVLTKKQKKYFTKYRVKKWDRPTGEWLDKEGFEKHFPGKKPSDLRSEDFIVEVISLEIRYDDECGNGHNTFSMTGSCNGASGCIHDEIQEAFPEFAHLIKWHLCSSDGPMHYLENTIWHAGDRDCHGKKAGEVLRWQHAIRFGDSPITHPLSKRLRKFLKSFQFPAYTPYVGFEIVEVPHPREPETFSPNYTFEQLGGKWHDCPFKNRAEAEEWHEALRICKVEFVDIPTEFSEGKQRDFDAARRSAVWPEATDEQLSSEPEELKQMLVDRLHELLQQFRADIEAIGFVF